jgi:hypothetical protein
VCSSAVETRGVFSMNCYDHGVSEKCHDGGCCCVLGCLEKGIGKG